MIIRANCKINIGLDIVARRSDGYHDIESVMLPIKELYDVVEVTSIEGSQEIIFEGRGLVVDCPSEENLCVRAARLMQSRFSTGGVAIMLDKRVPFGAGLGGGSADATAVIMAMNEIFGLGLNDLELIEIAALLGSDTSFFVLNTPQLCSGRGEVMEGVDLDLSGLTLVMVKPEDENISTREAYSGVTPSTPQHPLRELICDPCQSWMGRIKNDFEPHIFRAHPQLDKIKRELLSMGALYAAMSGSGSTIFALFDDPKLAEGARSLRPILISTL